MTITPEQKRAVTEAGREPVRLADPETGDAYYLVKEEVFERLGGVARHGSIANQEIPEGILRSKEAFLSDLPELLRLQGRKARWAAYHGEERVGLGATETELYQLCARRGLEEVDVYVGRIEPHPHPHDVEETDPSFFELDEIHPHA